MAQATVIGTLRRGPKSVSVALQCPPGAEPDKGTVLRDTTTGYTYLVQSVSFVPIHAAKQNKRSVTVTSTSDIKTGTIVEFN